MAEKPDPAVQPDAAELRGVEWQVVPPEKSSTVFVDITAYNSKNYYVLGDVLVHRPACPGPGTRRCSTPFNSRGLAAHRRAQGYPPGPAGRGGKPAKVYKVDLAAIQEKGDVAIELSDLPRRPVDRRPE